ncbi:MinD/ParA family protein [Phaeovibrio sulfidiphilus]|uniref:MinD/ParA family protein n=1 Tax=Phaeovibrio sulfidiphilus TaxID=1220600 RepID=A0A8J6YVL6_9PROT|nr:MinD/ParA family protein [Phaeovibrio sulfidiphilus]MBE1237229.1 MinD/ParA family protein [Phaeovibrio sulfidiphilus]
MVPRSSDHGRNAAPTLAAPVARGPRPGSNFIAIASGKGGVGKTWLAVTLSHALARRRERVLLFDGDLGLANVDLHLGLIPRYDLGSVISGERTLNQTVTPYPAGGFEIIAGRSGSGSLATLPPGRLQILIEDLLLVGRGYDRVILDLGAGMGRSNQMLAAVARRIVLVVNDEPTSMADAYAFIKLNVLDNPQVDIRIVVNASNSTREGERTYQTLLKACQSFLKYSPPLLGIVRRDTRVREAIRNQVPLLTRSPNADAALDVEAIADRLHELG